MSSEIQINNRIDDLFSSKKEGILNVYFTAGFPGHDNTAAIAEHLQEAGADIIEIGIPFSDPVADGPTIQESNMHALEQGMTLHKLMDQLSGIREKVSIPIILMGYMNPVMQYGVEEFCKKCEEIGVDGLILPDLPLQEYLDHYQETFRSHGLHNIFLISPQTSEERIRAIDEHSAGFIYMVSSASITGAKKGISDEQVSYFKRVNDMQLGNPRLIGFGISDNESFGRACEYASGAIIGSAFINMLRESNDLGSDITSFIHSVKGI
ncbi:tryptophan synthase subunit alpha [Roseivirga sp. BDSF3-8]|uniref:tryptophan synthase subunit alpha n=1 Tax=Roseivirga sp. BDSF3-8 TaxID=3241598 RepID=UPI0035318189